MITQKLYSEQLTISKSINKRGKLISDTNDTIIILCSRLKVHMHEIIIR